MVFRSALVDGVSSSPVLLGLRCVGRSMVLVLVCLWMILSESSYVEARFRIRVSPAMPQPFSRVLSASDSGAHGNDVLMLQHLISRSPFVPKNSVPFDGVFGSETMRAVSQFRYGNHMSNVVLFDSPTASLLLDLHSYDGYRDNHTIPDGYMYKVHIPVHRNRSIETMATLYDKDMKVLRQYRVRTHGQNDAFGNALNQFSSDGSTPTGLATFDLNSPEPDPVSYGPYPINRVVLGLEGNMKFLLPNIRNGILQHTGEWPNWNPSEDMPNSHGCIHGHPEDIKEVWQILIGLGVEVRKNPFGQVPYPYKPQGIISVEEIDG